MNHYHTPPFITRKNGVKTWSLRNEFKYLDSRIYRSSPMWILMVYIYIYKHWKIYFYRRQSPQEVYSLKGKWKSWYMMVDKNTLQHWSVIDQKVMLESQEDSQNWIQTVVQWVLSQILDFANTIDLCKHLSYFDLVSESFHTVAPKSDLTTVECLTVANRSTFSPFRAALRSVAPTADLCKVKPRKSSILFGPQP